MNRPHGILGIDGRLILKMDLKGIFCEDVDRIHIFQERVQ
jgi:hypothetical protein